MRALLTAGGAAVAVAAARAGALLLTGSAERSTTVPPRATANAPLGPLVLAGRGQRPVWSFVLQAADRAGDRGSATVAWTPRGRPMCPTGPVPLGRRATELAIVIESPEPVGGRALATIGPEPADCTRATGTWRGIDGALDDRSGALELTVDDGQVVRLQLTG